MITCLFWPDEPCTFLKLYFMLYKKRWGSKRFSLRGQYYNILHILSNITSLVIRIGSDPHIFCRIRISIGIQGMPIRIRLIDINSNQVYFLLCHENFNMLSEILKIITHLPLMWKEIYFNLPLLWIKVKKISPSFPKCAKLGEGSAFGSALFWCQSRIQTRIWASKLQVWSGSRSAWFKLKRCPSTQQTITLTIQYLDIW